MSQLQSDLNKLAEKIKDLVNEFDFTHEVVISDIQLNRVDVSTYNSQDKPLLSSVVVTYCGKGSN